jgi:hypothetical protein
MRKPRSLGTPVTRLVVIEHDKPRNVLTRPIKIRVSEGHLNSCPNRARLTAVANLS